MSQKRLLIADDEPDFCEFVRRVAEQAGYQVRIVTRPTEFQSAYLEFAPTRIVLDIVMPDVDGIELVQWLAAQSCSAGIMIITGYNPEFAGMAQSLGRARGLLSVKTFAKPVKVADLRAALA